MRKPRILYIEDMEECHEFTRQALGDSYEVVSVYTPKQAEDEIEASIQDYRAIISDVNLVYDSSKPDEEQTKEGLELIKLARKKLRESGIKNFPIVCVSKDGSHRKSSLESGANVFLWKMEFWGEKGKKYLDKIFEHQERWKTKKINQTD